MCERGRVSGREREYVRKCVSKKKRKREMEREQKSVSGRKERQST